MASSMNINVILDQLDELRAVFVLSQRSLPFLKEFSHFVREIAPLLEEIDTSLRESADKMPRATSQLKSVSEATELASTEILDLADLVLKELQTLDEGLKQATAQVCALEESDQRLLRLLRTALGEERPTLLDAAEALIAERATSLAHLDEKFEAEQEALELMREKINRIMISLQVQDITAQQIASVNHLIESVRHRLAQLVEQFGGEDGLPGGSALPTANGTFDEHARYDHSPARQHMADELVATYEPGTSAQAPPAQGAPTQGAPSAPAEKASAASQADIEQMFGGGDGERASQEDIDALFQ